MSFHNTIHKAVNIKEKLAYLQSLDDEYWSFKTTYKRDYSHNYFRYPAMMVPQMIRSILGELCLADPSIRHIHDPFVGSGTILTESMLLGLDFTGRDINPLSILLCKVKSGPFYEKAFDTKIELLLENIELDRNISVETKFRNIDKWFRQDVQIELSKIKRAIKQEKAIWARRFFWVVFAETIRQVSNSRTTTYKLHIRNEEQIQTRRINTLKIFKRLLHNNFLNLKISKQYLSEHNLLNKGIYKRKINLILGDARKKLKVTEKYDLVLTSPPYGDNHTTVTYGQYSYLPLQWIDLQDIDKKITKKYIETISAIDNMSLGGKNYKGKKFEKVLLDMSPAYRDYVKILQDKPKRFLSKVTAFFYDLYLTMDPILDNLNENGYLVWTLGNRTVCGINIKLDKILVELLNIKGITLLTRIERKISNKRMANKNQSSNTISKEAILVFKKG